MTNKTEAQPEALRLDESKRYSDVVHHANVKASIAYVARKTGLGYQETERLLELALQRGDLTEGDYSGRKMEKIADDRLASLEAQLVAQTNRAAAAEQQVTALTQRLDMANRLGNDARAELAQLRQAKDSLRAALADIASGEILRSHCTGPHCVEELGAATADDMVSRAAGALEWDDRLLAASPTPPARKGVSDEEIKSIYYSVIGAEARHHPVTVVLFARAIEAAHGIGASNDSAT